MAADAIALEAQFEATLAQLQQQAAENEALRQQLSQNSFLSQLNALQSQVEILKLRQQDATNPSPEELSSGLPRSFKVPNLDTYFGKKDEDLGAWLFQAEEQFSLLKIQDDDVRIKIAGLSMRSMAKTWYRLVRDQSNFPDEYLSSWDSFKSALRQEFSPVDPARLARDKLSELRQDQSVRAYTAQFRHLCTIIQTISEDEKLDRYVRGLKPRTRKEVDLRDPSTFAEAVRIAERLDTTMDRVFQRPANPAPRRNDGPSPMEINQLRAERGPRGPISSDEWQRRKDKGLCMYCGSDKHTLPKCSLKPFRRAPGNAQGHPTRGA